MSGLEVDKLTLVSPRNMKENVVKGLDENVQDGGFFDNRDFVAFYHASDIRADGLLSSQLAGQNGDGHI